MTVGLSIIMIYFLFSVIIGCRMINGTYGNCLFSNTKKRSVKQLLFITYHSEN